MLQRRSLGSGKKTSTNPPRPPESTRRAVESFHQALISQPISRPPRWEITDRDTGLLKLLLTNPKTFKAFQDCQRAPEIAVILQSICSNKDAAGVALTDEPSGRKLSRLHFLHLGGQHVRGPRNARCGGLEPWDD